MTQTAIASLRNWPAICAVQNALLRLLVAVTEEEEVLEGLRAGFPQLFCGEPSEELVVPASVIAHAAREYSENDECTPCQVEFDEKMYWHTVTKKFGIPTAFEFHMGEVPAHISKQLIGQKWQPGVRVVYGGVECLVAGLPETDGLQIGEEIPPWYIEESMTHSLWLYGVPAKFIDLNF